MKVQNSDGFSLQMDGNLYLKGENYRSVSAESSEIAVVKGENLICFFLGNGWKSIPER